MIAAAVGAFGAFEHAPRQKTGRKRQYADSAARKRAWRRRFELGDETPPRDETRDGRNLRVRLIDASNGNIDALADISPIRALLEQGRDLEADILPVIAREVPKLPRPG
jgi:hypothetical protein